jgi:hypothetical protein
MVSQTVGAEVNQGVNGRARGLLEFILVVNGVCFREFVPGLVGRSGSQLAGATRKALASVCLS